VREAIFVYGKQAIRVLPAESKRIGGKDRREKDNIERRAWPFRKLEKGPHPKKLIYYLLGFLT